jgi:phosphoribosylamine-glycine ligase
VYKEMDQFPMDGLFYRKDIGYRALSD